MCEFATQQFANDGSHERTENNAPWREEEYADDGSRYTAPVPPFATSAVFRADERCEVIEYLYNNDQYGPDDELCRSKLHLVGEMKKYHAHIRERRTRKCRKKATR